MQNFSSLVKHRLDRTPGDVGGEVLAEGVEADGQEALGGLPQ